MKHEVFDKLLNQILQRTIKVLKSKSAEYSTDYDKFYNFKRTATILGKSPEQALWGMALKHLVSIIDIIENIETNRQYPNKSLLEEKITDMVNYLILLEGVIKENAEYTDVQ